MKPMTVLLAAALFSVNSMAQDLSGHWRGVLQFAPEFSIVLGLKFTPDADGYQLELSSPNQGSGGQAPTTFSIDGNNLSFTDDKLKAKFSGAFNGETLSGTFTQGRDVAITLQRLPQDALARLQHEQRWFGDLPISKTASLPLVLNVAVVADGYHVTLDSPKQQSFGIPVNQFSQTGNTLSFSSALINASYQASWQQDEWQGTFVQGMAIPLNLKKKP